ncbi:hypothetical protein DITRI_Ditri01bG0139100 [Diplodiscus trichospermus]
MLISCCFQYDLSKFCPYNTVLVDHGNPSINKVFLTAATDKPGVALLDFVISPCDGWLLIIHLWALYTVDMRQKLMGFCLATIAHRDDERPCKITDTMAFMFESCLMPRTFPWALDSPFRDCDYLQCWMGLKSHFSWKKKKKC